MDFLEIRKKAKERAGKGGDAPAPRAPEPRPAPGDPAATPAAAPVSPAAPSRAEGAPPAPAPRMQPDPPGGDGRFTTWRPGSGAPPVPLAPQPASPRAPEPEPPVAAPEPAEPVLPPPAPVPERGAPRAAGLDEFFYQPDEEAPELPHLGSAIPEPVAPEEPIALEEYLTIKLGAEEYAVPIEQVREVMKAPLITEVPRAPAVVLGVVTVRGEVVAVFDPRRRLGLPPAPGGPEAGRVVIVDCGEGNSGLLVDAVSSVVRLRPGSIEPCPQGIGGASAECLAGIGRERERLFTVLDLEALLRPAPSPRRAGGAP